MDRDACIAFLEGPPTRTVALSTARPDGTTVTLPVWYRVAGDALHVWTDRERAWPQHLTQSGHASFSAYEEAHPFRAVIGGGAAELLTDGEIDVDAEVRLIVARYIHPDLADAYIARWSHLRDIARIRMDRLSGWSLGY